jgi:hypothetical protein
MMPVSLAPVYQSAPTNASPWKDYGLLAEATAFDPRDWIVGVGGRWWRLFALEGTMTRHLQFGRKVASLHLLCKVAYVQQLQGFLGHPPFARKCQPNVGPWGSAGNSSCFKVATPSYVSVNVKVDEFWPDRSAYPLWLNIAL